jgi:nucleoside-diphosphate-sugar epimerase
MITENLFVRENDSIKSVMSVIDSTGLGIALVTDDESRLKGTVTDGDIRKSLRDGHDVESPVKEIMNRNPISMPERFDKEQILARLTTLDNRFARFYSLKIPLVDSNDRVKNLAIYSVGEKKISFLYDSDYIVRSVKKVLVVGGAGYLGSVLCQKLLAGNFQVRVLDSLMFGEKPVTPLKSNPHFELFHGDIRNIDIVSQALDGVDAVIHLAGIVGDPASKNQPLNTIETNYLATMNLAQACRYHQINRYIFASTCSVYGLNNQILDEQAELNPVSLYARSKIKSEQGILSLVEGNFAPTILRMSTLHGLSPRMRFDLVVNIFSLKANVEGKIHVFGGDQWRPLLHVTDAADAFMTCLQAPIDKVKGEVFNVGSSEQNYQIKQLAEMVKEIIPGTVVETTTKETVDGKEDKRDYKVSFSKIEEQLGFKTKRTVVHSLQEISLALQDGTIADFNNPIFYNHKS